MVQIELLRTQLIECFPRNGHNVPKLPRVKGARPLLFGRQSEAALRKQAVALTHFLQVR
jgi:hypothetical protein